MPFSQLYILISIQLLHALLCPEAQSQDSIIERKATTINQDIRIQQLIKKRSGIEEKSEGMPGFRVQVFFGSTKQTALQTKTDFSELFEDIELFL